MGEMMRDINDRSELPVLMKELGLDGMVVEVGVETGQNASVYYEALLRGDIAGLVLIDPWKADSYISQKTPEEMDQIYIDVCKRFDHQMVSIMRKTSEQAARIIKPMSCDLVYIDGLHDYGNAYTDICVWWPKVKAGGILAGHDCNMAGVAMALAQFKMDCPWIDIRKSLSKADPSWYVRRA